MKKISIQIWHDKAKYWDDCKPTFHMVKDPVAIGDAITIATGKPVRMTYCFVADVGSCNGSYFHPQTSALKLSMDREKIS